MRDIGEFVDTVTRAQAELLLVTAALQGMVQDGILRNEGGGYAMAENARRIVAMLQRIEYRVPPVAIRACVTALQRGTPPTDEIVALVDAAITAGLGGDSTIK